MMNKLFLLLIFIFGSLPLYGDKSEDFARLYFSAFKTGKVHELIKLQPDNKALTKLMQGDSAEQVEKNILHIRQKIKSDYAKITAEAVKKNIILEQLKIIKVHIKNPQTRAPQKVIFVEIEAVHENFIALITCVALVKAGKHYLLEIPRSVEIFKEKVQVKVKSQPE